MVVLPEPVTPITTMITRRGCSFSTQNKNNVEQNENGDDYFQHEHTALVELSDHEFVELTGGLELFVDQRFVIVHANFCRAKPIDARVVGVADEFDGIFGAFGQIHDIEAKAVDAAGAPRQAPAGEKTFLTLEGA